jgi:hypothetical protein
MTTDHHTDPATERVIATISDDDLAARYPERAHFISAGDPHQGEMATRALFAGDPVVIVYADGHELLIRPDQARGLAGFFLVLAAFFLRRSRGPGPDVVQLPPRARVEARDAGGHPVAA